MKRIKDKTHSIKFSKKILDKLNPSKQTRYYDILTQGLGIYVGRKKWYFYRHLLDYSTNKRFYKYLEYKVFNKKTAKNYFENSIRDKKMYYFLIYFKNKIIGTIALRKLNYKKKS